MPRVSPRHWWNGTPSIISSGGSRSRSLSASLVNSAVLDFRVRLSMSLSNCSWSSFLSSKLSSILSSQSLENRNSSGGRLPDGLMSAPVVDGQVNPPALASVERLSAGALAKRLAAKRVVASSIMGSGGGFFEMRWEATVSLSFFFTLLVVSFEGLLLSLSDDGTGDGSLVVTPPEQSSASILSQLSSDQGAAVGAALVSSKFRYDTGVDYVCSNKNSLGH